MAPRVLLADDSTTIHRIVRDILEPEGIEVVCVENGEEALRSILESPPELVLADLTMPRMGGIDMCELMRREVEFQDIPVIFLVSPFDEFDQATGARIGGTGHLVKPFDSYRLLSLVKQYLPGEQPEAEGTEVVVEAEDDDSSPDDPWTLDAEQEDAAELPEPIGLTQTLQASEVFGEEEEQLEELPDDSLQTTTSDLTPGFGDSALDLSPADDDRMISLLPTDGALVEVTDDEESFTSEGEESQEVNAATRTIHELAGDGSLEAMIREVIRQEVRKILPAVVEEVVRQRVLELELELGAMERAQRAAQEHDGD